MHMNCSFESDQSLPCHFPLMHRHALLQSLHDLRSSTTLPGGLKPGVLLSTQPQIRENRIIAYLTYQHGT